jgi:patatin-like phospholipase/acyl hydrolase
MEIDDNDIPLAIEDQPLPPTDDDVDLHGINEVLIRNNTILKCKFVFKIDDGEVSEFTILNDLLPEIFMLDREILQQKVFRKISLEPLDEMARREVCNWLMFEGRLLVVKFLPYLSLACKMQFHRCEIEDYNNHRVFVPVERNHEISTAIYYKCNSSGQNIIALFITNYAYTVFRINHYHELLTRTNDTKLKIQHYQKLIPAYIEQANTLHFHQHLLLLSKWQEIYNCYMAMNQLGHRRTSIETLNYCQCLIMLCKYKAAEDKIKKSQLLSTNSVRTDEVWCLKARAQRKRKQFSSRDQTRIYYENYSAANVSINVAWEMDHDNEKIAKEKIIIDKLITRKSLENAPIDYTIEHRRRNDKCPSYNILSIDGGGIRGIIAAIWLRELERKTNRTCSSMFQMMAGTSTGAIIAAGLSLPKINSLTQPAYDASKLVELYKGAGKDIFVKKIYPVRIYRNISFSLAPQYKSGGRRQLFETYFHDTLLRECLTDIVIPAVRTGDAHTHLFTRNNSLYSTRVVDVLMATSAAPTYFKPHLIDGTYYIDGGVQMNNPTMAAYTKAIEYGYDKENIYVLSLGTGDYIQDRLTSNAQRDLIYYVENNDAVLKVLLDSQQHNVDYQMSILMNDEHYYRWQVWFEEFIELDEYKQNVVNKLENIAYEYWEEMEVYDDNRLNKLIERLSRE